MAQQLILSETEVVSREKATPKRYPNLGTVLMVEDFLKEHQATPMKLSDIKRQLPKKVMHATLKLILEYLWRGGKIIYGPKGIQWIYADREQLNKMIKGGLEI